MHVQKLITLGAYSSVAWTESRDSVEVISCAEMRTSTITSEAARTAVLLIPLVATSAVGSLFTLDDTSRLTTRHRFVFNHVHFLGHYTAPMELLRRYRCQCRWSLQRNSGCGVFRGWNSWILEGGVGSCQLCDGYIHSQGNGKAESEAQSRNYDWDWRRGSSGWNASSGCTWVVDAVVSAQE